MKNYILAFMLVPFLLFGQKFKNSELITENKEGDKKGRSIAVETVPRLLSYQGFLTVGGAGPVSDGQYTVNFRLFDQEEDGNEFWNETHLLTISDGLVSALLGSNGFPIETVPMNSYLEIEIDGNTLSPRQQITSVMYAIKSDTTYFAKGYTKTADLSQVAMSGEYSDLLNSPDLTPFATKDSLGYYATLDSLDSYTLTSELSVVAFSGEYEDILNTPDLADYAVTDTLSYYATLDSLGYYVSEDSLFQYIGSTIQPYDTELQQIADLRDLEQGHLIVYDGTELTWTAQGGADARSALGLGDMAVQESDSVVITGGSISGIEDLTVSDGGTGASTSEGARDSLGLQIGVDVQGFDSDLQTIATQNHSENPNVKQMLISRGYYWEARSADSARIDLGLKIGQDVQAWNQDLQNYADGQDIPADKVQYGEYFINQPGQQGQIWGSDANEAGRWSNLGDYLTYEVTGTDSATSIEFDVDVGTGPNQVIALDVNQKLPAVNASRLVGITADQINDSTVSNSEFNMLSGVRTISGEDGPGGLIQDQLDNKAQKGNNTDILSITGLTTMLAINQGGTGASTAEDARTNLDAQQQNVHLDDLAEDGILSASKVQYGNFFVKDAGDAGFQWTSDGVDEGYWAPGGDIAHVYTTAGRGILINGATVAEAGSVKVEVDAGAAVGQIPQLEFSSNWEGGKLPAVDGSGLLHINAEQINASSARPVTNEQFDLLTDLRTTSTADSAGGPIQAQLDNKQDQSIYLDDIVTASAGNVTDSDLLIWKVVDGDGSWELLASDDETYNVTASRVEHGEFFINDAGITGQYWSSDGSESGEWRTYGPRFTVGADTLAIRTGTNAGDIVELVTGGKLPAVDGSLLREITALQINDSTVKNTEFNALAGLRLAGQDLPEANATEFRYQAGDIQVQLDGKMNYHANLADLVDGPLTYDLVQYGEYFIKEPSDLEGKVWTWSSGGFGDWVLPPGAQWIGDLNDASTSPANSNNLFLGALAGENPSGANNLGVGSGSLRYITSGNINVAVGTNAGSTIQTGNANVLIGNNAGSGLLSNADNKLIIDNGNSNLGVTNPLIGGSFDPSTNRGVIVDGTLLSREDLSTANDINIVEVNQDNSVVGDLFAISQSSGDVTMKNTSPGKKINFVVDQNNTVLTLDGNDGMVKLPGTVKIASDDDVLTHINATNSGANLNVMGATKVFVRGGDASAGRIQLMAKDSLRLKSDFIEIDSPQEFIVQNDMRVGGNFRIGDVTNSEFKISNDGSYNTVIENKITDKDIIFKGYPSGSVTEIMRVDGSGESLLMYDDQKLEFRDTGTYMHSTQSNTLALVAPSLNITSTSGVTLDTNNPLQFRGAATYVASSADNVLDIVGPTIVASQSGTAAGTVYIGTGGANKVEAADATSMTVTSPILVLNGSTRTSVQAELQLKDQLVFNDAADELSIAETGTDDYTIKNLTQDKDIIVNVNVGGADTEVARFDGSASSLLMASTNKIEFTDANHFVNNSGSSLDVMALNGTVKVGKFTDGDAANTTALVQLEGTTITSNTDDYRFTSPDKTPLVTLKSNTDDLAITSGTSLLMEKIRPSASPQANDILGNIMAKGENDSDDPINYTNIQFRSTLVGAASERGSIEFVTKGATGSDVANEILLDINQTTANTVTVHQNLSVEGSMSLNGAAFKDDITSDARGENNLGTDGTGEWASVNLYDQSGSNAKITFGDGSDATTDLHLQYDPSPAGNTQALMINRENRLQFRDAATYVASSASNVLDLVAPTLVASQSGTAAGTVYIGTGGANKVEAADATSMTITSPILVLNGSTKTIALGEAEFQDSLIFSENGSDVNELVIAQSGTNDYTIANMVQDKDIIFNLKPGGSATEIARFDGSASSLLMAGTNKVEFNVASNSISSNGDGSVFSVASGGELKLDVNTIEMSNGTDYAMTMAKNLAAEVLKSDQPSKPVWTLENSSAAAQNGSILEFKKVATQDDGVMGSIRSVTGDGAFAQIDFKGEGATNSQTGSMVFTTYDATVAKQVMDISATAANTVTIGTSGNDANLKVYGTLTAASTAYENDILPAVRGGAGLGQSTREWDDLWIYDEGLVSFGGHNITAVSLTHDDGTGDANPGLILDTDSRLYFDDVNQHIAVKTDNSGILEVVSATEVEVNGGALLDLDADQVTIDASAVAGMQLTTTLGDIALTTSAVGKKVTVNTNASAILSHTANGDAQDFTIEQVGAVDASLILNSAGTGTNAIALNASAGGMDIDATNSTLTITNTADGAGDHMTIAQAGAQNASLILSSAGTATDALTISTSAGGMDISVTGDAAGEDLDISTTNATTEMRLTSASSEADAIKLNASAGGIQIDAAAASNLTTSAGDLTIGGATQANAINIQSDESDAAAIRLNASDASGGIDMDAGGDIAINSTNLIITPVTLTSNVGDMEVKSGATDTNPAKLFITADRGDDAADKWLVTATDNGSFSIANTANGTDFTNQLTVAADGTVTATSFSGGMSSGVISSDTDAANALEISTSAGGIDITAGGDTAGDDLDITATGTATEIRITSASTQADAILMNTSAGGIDINSAAAFAIDGAAASTLTTSAGDLTLTADAADAKVVIKGDHTGAAAVHIDANENAASILDLDAGVLDVDATTSFTIDGAGASTITVDNNTLSLATTTGGELDVTSAAAVDINAAAAFTIDGAAASTINVTSADLNLTTTTGGELDVTSAAAVDINAAAAFTIDGAAASTINVTSADLNLTTTTGGELDVTSAAAVDINAAAAFTIDGAAASTLTTSAGDLTLTADAADAKVVIKGDHTGAAAVHIDANENAASIVDLDAGILDVDASGSIDFEAATGISIDAGAASNLTTSAGALTVDGATGLNFVGNGSEIDLTTTDNVEINATTLALKNGTAAGGGSITFYEDSDSDGDADEKIKIQTPELAADYTLTLPVDDGDAGFVLKTDGDGVLSWSLDLANNSQGTNTNTFGASSPIDDDNIVVHFNKTTNDGYLRWVQASDYFQFDDDILMESAEKVQFGSTSDYIHVTGSNLTSVAAADYVVDAASEVILDYGSGQSGVVIKEAGTVIGSIIKKSGANELEIKSGATSSLQFDGANVDVRGDLTVTGGNITNALQFDGDVSLNGGHLGLQFVDGSKNSIGFPDNMESGLIVNEGANAYMGFNSTDNEEEISLIQDTRIVDDKKIEFGTHSDASIEYDNDGTSQLRFAGAAAIFEQAVTFAGGIANPGTVTTTDIDGGTIDGTVIGASSQAAGDFTAIGAVAPGTIVGTTIDATTDFTIASLVVTDDQIQMTPSTNDVVTIAGATNGILNITTVDDAGTSGDVNLTADGQVEYRANDAAGHIFDIAGTDQLSITDGVIAPVTDNDIALGTTALSYSDLFLADGSVLNLDNGDITLTHSDGKLTLGGDGDVEVDFNDHEMTNVDINSGNIDGVRIGYNAGRGGKFSNLWTTGQIWLQNDANDAGVGLKSPDALGASYSLEFPADDGSNNEVLITNGSGVLSWGTVNTANITADAIDATKIADDVIDDEHIDPMFMSSIAGGAVVDGNDIVLLRDPGVGIKARSLTDIFGVMGRPEAPPTPNSSSDRRFKKNISTVSGALQKLSKLNPVNYDWRQDEFENKGFNDKKQWGFIAQEIKEIFPELVGKDDEDFLTLNYQGFVPLLTKAVQEQQEEIDSQQKEIDALKSQLQMIMDMLDNDMSDKTDSKKDNDNKKPVKLSMATPK